MISPSPRRWWSHVGFLVLVSAFLPSAEVVAAPAPAEAGKASATSPGASAGNAAASRVTFASSLAPLPVVSAAKSVAGRLAASSAGAISAAQLASTLDLQVAMAMRNFDEFQTRVSNGETVPFDEIESKYLPLPGDYDAVRRWLVDQGFSVTMDDERRLGIFIGGTAAQVQRSFGVTMGSVTVDGVVYAAATTAPSLPTSIAGGVLGIHGLQPYLKLRKHSRFRAADARATTPAATSYAPPYLVPAIRTAYDAATLSVGGTTLTGANQKIAIIIDTFPLNSDLTSFWSANSITQSLSNIEEVNVPKGTLDAISGEETLDVEWSSSIAPGCKVRVYASDTLSFTYINKCLSQVATDVTGTSPAQPAIHQLSMSLGIGEKDLGLSSSVFTTESQYFTLIANGSTANGGVSVFVSTGDDGSTPDVNGGATGPLQASYESTDPSVTAVGGTALTLNTNTGLRTSEVVWDDTVAPAGYAAPGATGGGTSAKFSRPSWQTGTGVPAGTMRLVPDVALVAAESTPAFLVFNGSATQVAGTSWSAPTWAGFAALINQGRSVNTPARLPVGLLNPRIYPLIGTNNFYDITSGTNVLNAANAGTTNGVPNYTAQTGYDECTGVGVPDVAILLNTLLGPTISSFGPNNVPAGGSVVITGTNFYGVTAVSFSGTSATSFTVNSPTQITAVVPAGVAASGNLTVTSFGDVATSATAFVQQPDGTPSVANTGTISQDDVGDVFTVTVSNVGAAATTGPVSVRVTSPTGSSISQVSGTGWTCSPATASAANTVWYCSRSDTLTYGASYPALTCLVNFGPDIATASPVQFQALVSFGNDYNSGNDGFADSFTVAAVNSTPTQRWRYQYFATTANTGTAADSANPAGDGLPNLLKYALGLSPLVPGVNPSTESTGSGYLTLTVPKNSNATDLTYSVQVNGDLTNPAGWTTAGTTVDQNTASLLQVQDNTPVSGTAKRFIRLQVSR